MRAFPSLVLTIVVSLCIPAASDTCSKKLIQYGPEFPDTKYVRENIRQMEKVGFDGVVIRVARNYAPVGDPENWSMGYRVFCKRKLDIKDAEPAIADLQAARSRILTDNFIQVCASMPADADWFDPEWEAVPHNAGVMARVAKLGGCKGLMIDPEEYGSVPLWTYRDLVRDAKTKRTLQEYRLKVRERGREFIRAINKEYPDITLLFLLGSSFGYQRIQAHGRAAASYSLLPDFIDGICEAATPGTIVVDGYEQSYGYRRREFFQYGLKYILEDTKTISAVPIEYAEHVRAGFGVSMDNGEWNTKDFSKNFFTPVGFHNSLAYALETADKYVWIWTGNGPEWWGGRNIPAPYLQALKLAKKGPTNVKDRDFVEKAPKAASLDGYSDEITFARFYKTKTELLDLPKDYWRFARDPEILGESKSWFSPAFNDTRWQTISIGEFWETQGVNYDGDAWYRRTIQAPDLPQGKRIYLAFGAVDETAKVYLNGVFVGSRDLGEGGWDKPFYLDVTTVIQSGKPNRLAVHVGDTGRLGGIWKSVKLMVDRKQ